MKKFLLALGLSLTIIPYDISAMQNTETKNDRRLRYAAAVGNPEVVQEQLKLGAHIETKDKHGKTPLILAAAKWYDNGKEQFSFVANHDYDQEDIATCSILDKQAECIKILLESGANGFYRDENKLSFIDYIYSGAFSGGDTTTLKALIEFLENKQK